MGAVSRSNVPTATAGAAALGSVAACSGHAGKAVPVGSSSAAGTPTPAKRPSPVPSPNPSASNLGIQVIGDGSTSDTGPQPHQPKPERMTPGEPPPQFVVFSWDGSAELDTKLFSRFRRVALDHGAAMTFFLSGIYTLPEAKRNLYHPPQHPVGASDIRYLSDEHIHSTLEQLGEAWLDGHEIGTHFNGHFCGPNGVGRWSPAEWRSEIDQAMGFVMNWRTNTGFTDLPALPFDYHKELIGGRTPCLEGRDNLLPTAADLGWRYDASSPGGRQVWPDKRHDLWDLPLQSIPFSDHTSQVLSMDYNILFKQTGGILQGDAAMRPTWKRQAHDAFLAGFHRAYQSNRAPYFVGNHFEQWNGGIYMDAVEEVIGEIASQAEVRLVSFRQFVAWLDAQDPAVLRKLRTLNVGQAPADGWEAFLSVPSATPA